MSRAQLSPSDGPGKLGSVVNRHWVTALLAYSVACTQSACGDGALVTLGEQGAAVTTVSEYVDVRRIDVLSDDSSDDENPTLTDSMQEIYFDSPDREGAEATHDVWRAERSPDGGFGEPVALEPWSEDGYYSSPAISGNGLTLWLAYRDGESDATDIYRVARESVDAPFSDPGPAGTWDMAHNERPRPLGQNDTVMPLSRRIETPDGNLWQTLFVTLRTDGNLVDPTPLEGLEDEGVSVVDGFLSQDGLTFLYKRIAATGEPGDLYWAQRDSVDEHFVKAEPVPGPDVNTDEYDERDPWLSADKNELFFVSNRAGTQDIYSARRVTRRANQ